MKIWYKFLYCSLNKGLNIFFINDAVKCYKSIIILKFCFLTEEAMFSWKKFHDISVRVLRIV